MDSLMKKYVQGMDEYYENMMDKINEPLTPEMEAALKDAVQGVEKDQREKISYEEKFKLEKIAQDIDLDNYFYNNGPITDNIKTILEWSKNTTSPIHENSGTAFFNHLRVLKDDASAQKILKQLEGKNIIELGPGKNPQGKYMKENYNIGKYTGVDLDAKSGIVNMNALEFLAMQDDDSAIIISFGFFCPEKYSFTSPKDFNPRDSIQELMIRSDRTTSDGYNFLRMVAKEVYRVTPKNGLSIHAVNPDFYSNHVEIIKMAGFNSVHTGSAGTSFFEKKDVPYSILFQKN